MEHNREPCCYCNHSHCTGLAVSQNNMFCSLAIAQVNLVWGDSFTKVKGRGYHVTSEGSSDALVGLAERFARDADGKCLLLS
jgi:hypothetical protein